MCAGTAYLTSVDASNALPKAHNLRRIKVQQVGAVDHARYCQGRRNTKWKHAQAM